MVAEEAQMTWGKVILGSVAAFGIIMVAVFLSSDIHLIGYLNDIVSENVTEVRMPDDLRALLNSRLQGSENEFLYCLEGTYSNGAVRITDWYVPEGASFTEERISSFTCKNRHSPMGLISSLHEDEVVGSIHSHPSGNCMPSSQDYYTFGRTGDRLMGIICGVDEMVFYPASDVTTGIQPKSL